MVWGSIISKSFDRYLQCGKVIGPCEGLDAMDLLEGVSEWAGPRWKNCKPQEIFVEVFLTGRPLSIWRENSS
jgi:hypothetical protein